MIESSGASDTLPVAGTQPDVNDDRQTTRAWVLSVLQRRPDILARLAYFRGRLARLPRTQRRWIARRAALPLSAVALMLALSGTPAGLSAESAATITVANTKVTVQNDGLCSLIEAINNANATSGQPHADCVAGSASGADTIVLPTNGTFNLTASHDGSDEYGENGLPEITSAIIIEGNGSTIRRTGNEEFRLISVRASGDLTLNEVTLTGGNPGYNYGGAVMVLEGKLAVNDSTITGNEADGGGAIYANYGEVTVTGSMLSDNEAYSGSAVDARYSTLTISDSRLIDNKGPDGFGGAAIYAIGDGDYGSQSGKVTITDTTISGNSNDGGGAVMVTFGTLDLIDSTVSDNTTKEGYGAGVYLNGVKATITGTTISGNTSTAYSGAGAAFFGGTITISNSVIDDNTSGYLGGGVYTINADLIINETTISNNSAATAGGGVTVYGGEVLIQNTTIAGNTSELGGGLQNQGTTFVVNSTLSQNTADMGGGVANSGKLRLTNTTVTRNEATAGVGGGVQNGQIGTVGGELTLQRALIAGNTASGLGPQVHSSGALSLVNANSHNLFGASGVAGVVGFTPGASDIVPTQVVTAILQNALADNGGPTQTHALVPNSPAIDAGPTTACALPLVNSRDQRGEPRSRDANGQLTDNECDLGAFEAPGELVVTESSVLLPVILRQ